MRRLGALIVIIILAVALRFALKRPVSVELELDYGTAAPREATLVFTRDEQVERELKLQYPEHAPARDRRTVRLVPGHYSVGVLLDGSRNLTRPLDVDQAGIYTLLLN